MKILITGFEPFGDNEKNISQEVLQHLDNSINGVAIVKKVLPVVFNECIEVATSLIKSEKPDAVICLGQRASYDGIAIERIAINLMDSVNPDNKGFTPKDEIIENQGEIAYFSTLPIKQIFARIKNLGIVSKISNTAGLYVCNNLMYGVLHYISANNLPIISGFIHLPSFGKMDLNSVIEAVNSAIMETQNHIRK